MNEKPYYMAPVGALKWADLGGEDGTVSSMLVHGMAVDYNRVAYFSPRDRLAVKAGAAAAALERRAGSSKRDVLALIAHDPSRPVGRTANGSLEFKDSPEGLMYELQLDPADPEAVSAYAKVKSGLIDAASIGFMVRASEAGKMPDNSPDAVEAGAEVEVELATEIDVFEVSLVPHGAMGGATAFTAHAMVEGAVQEREATGTVASDAGTDSLEGVEAAEEADPSGDAATWREAVADWVARGIYTPAQAAEMIGA